jgi:hypothetical protein
MPQKRETRLLEDFVCLTARGPQNSRIERSPQARNKIDFETINRAALAALPAVLARIVPGGKRVGREHVVLNPTRADRHLGSFKINLHSGRWRDL